MRRNLNSSRKQGATYMLFALACVAIGVCKPALATTIDACSAAIGTDVTNAGKSATLSYATSANGTTSITTAPTTIIQSPLTEPDFNCGGRALGGFTGELGSPFGDGHELATNPTIDDFTSPSFWTGLLVEFDRPATSFDFTGFSQSGDVFIMMLYDTSGAFIDTVSGPGVFGTRIDGCVSEANDGGACWEYSASYEAISTASIGSAYLGSGSGAVWVDSISYTVPEPGTALLMGLALCGAAASRRRTAKTRQLTKARDHACT